MISSDAILEQNRYVRIWRQTWAPCTFSRVRHLKIYRCL